EIIFQWGQHKSSANKTSSAEEEFNRDTSRSQSVHVLWIIPKQRHKIISGQTLLLTNWFKDIASPVDTPLLHHVADQLLIDRPVGGEAWRERCRVGSGGHTPLEGKGLHMCTGDFFDAVYMLQAQRKGIDNYHCQQKIM
ncbi:unnamed protein product, partial [Timema podura]|nr:unnamed protein product [Timema podura]